MEQYGNSNEGSLKISEEVISTIAGMAASEINGVAGLSLRPNPDLKGFFSSRHTQKNVSKAIRLEVKDGDATIDVYVNLYMGTKIPDVAAEIQSRVKDAVQNMTGITVSKVNVHVAGVVFTHDTDAEN